MLAHQHGLNTSQACPSMICVAPHHKAPKQRRRHTRRARTHPPPAAMALALCLETAERLCRRHAVPHSASSSSQLCGMRSRPRHQTATYEDLHCRWEWCARVGHLQWRAAASSVPQSAARAQCTDRSRLLAAWHGCVQHRACFAQAQIGAACGAHRSVAILWEQAWTPGHTWVLVGLGTCFEDAFRQTRHVKSQSSEQCCERVSSQPGTHSFHTIAPLAGLSVGGLCWSAPPQLPPPTVRRKAA
jgi:hypothetical protein